MLASDLNNPEFVGATNPDSALAVTFRWDKRLNEFRSKEEGRPIYDWMDWIHIQVPGNQLTDINRPVESRDKLRFPIQWARYQAAKEGGTVVGVGTPLEQWQYEVAGGGRVWYAISDADSTVWITKASARHPNETK